MKRIAPLIGAGAAALLLSACAYDEGYGHHGYHGGFAAAVGYDGFYDDYYGPFYDGYWGGDGDFYYSPGVGRAFLRDSGHHFRHEGGAGFHDVHGHPHH